MACGDDLRRGYGVRGNFQGAGEIVRRSQWQNAERQACLDQSRRRGVQRTVTATDDHAVDGAEIVAG